MKTVTDHDTPIPSVPDEEILVSTIMRVHNCHSTVGMALRSLMEQTLGARLEIIIVDDGSTDGSLAAIRGTIASSADPLPHIRIIRHEYKQGSANALNTGLAHANGRYVTLCDADDYVDPEFYQQLVNAAESSSPDIVTGSIRRHHKNTSKVIRCRHFSSLNGMPLDTAHFSMCNKLIRCSLIDKHDIKAFPHVDCWEDLGILARVMMYSPTIVHTDIVGYNYVRHDSSITHRPHDVILHDHLRCAILIENELIRLNRQTDYSTFLLNLKFFAKVKYLRGKNRDIRRWQQTFPEVNRHIFGVTHLQWWMRPLFYLLTLI